MQLSAVRVFVRDLDAARRFYAGVLGLRLTHDDAAHGYCSFESAGLHVVVETVAVDAPAMEQALVGRFTGVSFAVDDVDATHARLRALGVEFSGLPETQAWGGRLATLKDPSGNELQLVQYPTTPAVHDAELSFATSDTPTQPEMLAVDTGLDEHNQAAAPLGDVRPLAAFARQGSGLVAGGAVGRTWGRCCELQQLWVADPQRGRGVGSRLLREFEAHARTRGCNVFYLTTLSFQAPEFYRRHGYTVLARIDGYPDDIVKFLMHKSPG